MCWTARSTFRRPRTRAPDRTGSVILSDPEGSLSFGTGFAEDDTGMLWVNRLVRVQHTTSSRPWGSSRPPRSSACRLSVGRSGGEVTLELSDKSLLGDHGVRPMTLAAGMNVRDAIATLLRDQTGERNYRVPETSKRLPALHDRHGRGHAQPVAHGEAHRRNRVRLARVLLLGRLRDLRADQHGPAEDQGRGSAQPARRERLVQRVLELRQGLLRAGGQQHENEPLLRAAPRQERGHGGRGSARADQPPFGVLAVAQRRAAHLAAGDLGRRTQSPQRSRRVRSAS